MTTDLFASLGVDSSMDDQARRAVQAGKKMLPMLSAFARVLTKRDDVRVVLRTLDNGSTDGTKIHWRPPLELGVVRDHDRRLCDKRDPDTEEQLCAACRASEAALVVIYHEIAHICFDSFQVVSDEDKVAAIERAAQESGKKYSAQVRERLENSPYWKKGSYISLANLVSEYLPLLVNCLEDARVNAELFKARKGTKVMFQANVKKIMRDGVEQIDPSTGQPKVISWYDYPLNAQVMVGLFSKACRYDYTNWFRPEVIEALADSEITDLVRQVDTTRSAQGIYNLAFPILARLRELGFCKNPYEPQDEEDEENQQDESDEQDDQSDEPEAGEQCDDADESGEPQEGAGSGSEHEEDSSEGEGSSDGESDVEDDPSGSDDDDSGSAGEPSGDEGSDNGDASASDADEDEGPAEGEGAGSSGSDDNAETSEADSDTDESSPSGNDVGSSGSDGTSADNGEEPAEHNGDSSDSESLSSSDDQAGETDSGEPQATADTEFGSGDISGNPLDDERQDEDSVSEPEDDLDSRESGEGASTGGGTPTSTDSEDGLDGLSTDDEESNESQPSLDNSDHAGERTAAEDAGDDSDDSAEHVDDAGSDGQDDHSSDDDGELIDTGADRGCGGVEVVENEANDDLPVDYGTKEEAEVALVKFGEHEEVPDKVEEQEAEHAAVDRAIIQGLYFESPSKNIWGVREHRYGQPIYVNGNQAGDGWVDDSRYSGIYSPSAMGRGIDLQASESVLGPALLRMRVVFSDNMRGKDRLHQRSGKVDGRVLGRRAWQKDDRLFRTRSLPGKKDYFVLIGGDISGSQLGKNIVLTKLCMYAQAELCHRMGIKFAIYCHSGWLHDPASGRGAGMDLDIYFIKEPNEPWNDEAKKRLHEIGPDACNLDGHTLEYYRKILDGRPETEKILLYYTDGKMPAENAEEELEILQREIKKCRQKRYTLLGVGIRTDSPKQHGLDTVQVDSEEEIGKVIKHLEKRLLTSGAG